MKSSIFHMEKEIHLNTNSIHLCLTSSVSDLQSGAEEQGEGWK